MFVWCPDGIYAMIIGVNNFHLFGGTFNQVVLNIDECHMEIGLSLIWVLPFFFCCQQSLARRTYPCHGQHACIFLLSGAASGTFLVSSLFYLLLCELKCCDDLSKFLVLFILGQVTLLIPSL